MGASSRKAGGQNGDRAPRSVISHALAGLGAHLPRGSLAFRKAQKPPAIAPGGVIVADYCIGPGKITPITHQRPTTPPQGVQLGFNR